MAPGHLSDRPVQTRPRIVSGRAGLLGLRGEDLGWSGWKAVSQSMVDTFADLTDDHTWIHVDRERAADGPYGQTIAHGFLTLALIPMFMQELIRVTDVAMAVNYGLDRVRFPAPAPVGRRLRGGMVVREVLVKNDSLETSIETQIVVEEQEKPACVAIFRSRFWPSDEQPQRRP